LKALSKLKAERGLWLVDVPKPTVGPNDVLIKITKTAICGTDLHIYKWDPWSQKTIPVPMVVGHEYVGIVEQVGSEVSTVKVGGRVSGEGHIVCGVCRSCRAGRRHLCSNPVSVGVDRPGAFAEYLCIPESNVYPIPDNISDDVASILDPLGNAVHTALEFDVVGEDVLIAGAGPIGIMAAAVVRHVGARHVVIMEIHPYRLKLASKINHVLPTHAGEKNLDTVRKELGMSEGFDVGLEMSGNDQAFKTMLNMMTNGGKIACLGISPQPFELDWSEIVFKGLVIHGIYGRKMFETWYKMIAMLQSGLDVNPVITHHFSVEQFEEAFELGLSGNAGKIILEWQ